MKRTLAPMIVLLSAATVATAPVSCTASRDAQPQHPAPRADAPMAPSAPVPTTTPSAKAHPDPAFPRHGLQNDELADLMRRMSVDTQENWPNDVPGPRDDQQADALAKSSAAAGRLAAGLESAAKRIPQSVRHTPMSEADRAGFVAEADLLADQAHRLDRAARDRNGDQIRRSLDAISATCLSCHTRYRDFAGTLDLYRASTEEPGDAALLARVWSR